MLAQVFVSSNYRYSNDPFFVGDWYLLDNLSYQSKIKSLKYMVFWLEMKQVYIRD